MSSAPTHIILNLKDPRGWILALIFGLLFYLGSNKELSAQNRAWYQPGEQNRIIEVAASQIGVTEATGNNDGFDVEKYLATTGLGAGYAWCAAFVNWVMIETGSDCPEKMQAWSPSWFPPERTYYAAGSIELIPPQPGDVFGIYFKSKNRIAHVGIIKQWHGKYADTIEGNTNDAGSREGNGVWQKKRLKKQVSKVSKWSNG